MIASYSTGVNSTQPGLSTTSVICPLDPGHDRDSQLIPGGPPATVENVLLQQSEERFHRGVIASRADSSHRSDDAVAVQCASEFLRSELGGFNWSLQHLERKGRPWDDQQGG